MHAYEKKGRSGTDTLVRNEQDDYAEPDQVYRCVNCGSGITTPDDIISVNNTHEHTFVNPDGYIFCIGCFGESMGCLAAGTQTTEHTWFAGHAWQYALCGHCTLHLGWIYHAAHGGRIHGGRFYGLILDRLVQP